uniref:Cytoplasmic tRNA 2-thiolation protein 2 n=1 Tax=Ditylenchus dipsaci TaxID=166011 RepID=A0A915E3R7_9BILA
MTINAEPTRFHKCVKCPEKGEYFGLDIKKAVYCQPCFINMVKHKFCFLLGKHKIFKDTQPENAIVLYSGDPASALLLSLVNREQFHQIHSMLKIFAPDWKVHFVHLAAALEPTLSFDSAGQGEQEASQAIRGFDKVNDYFVLLKSIKCNSLRHEMSRILQNILVFRAAKALNCSKVITSENMESLANTSLNVLCLGRGPAISHLTSVVDLRMCSHDDKNCSPVLIRPLRDICNREIELFHQLEDTQQLVTQTNPSSCETDRSSNGGLQSITSEFLTNLQATGYPSTTTTILSVCSKVESLCRGEGQEIRCSMCLCPFFQEEVSDLEQAEIKAWIDYRLCRTCLDMLQEIGEDVNIMSSIAQSSPSSQGSKTRGKVVGGNKRGPIWDRYDEVTIDSTGQLILRCQECSKEFNHPSRASTLTYHWNHLHGEKEQPAKKLRNYQGGDQPRAKQLRIQDALTDVLSVPAYPINMFLRPVVRNFFAVMKPKVAQSSTRST